MSFNFGAALAVFLAAISPGSNGTLAPQSVREMTPVIAPAQLKMMLATATDVVLVDVREPDEFAAGHIEGARLVPLGTIATAYRNLPKVGKLVVYCRSGKRSAKAVAFLAAHGYTNAVSLDGGFLAYTALN